MQRNGFSDVAYRYERDSVLQRSAADVLLGLIAIGAEEDVLDVGCGTGQLTAKIRDFTKGRIVGIDPAAGMIHEARSRYGGLNIEFQVGTAEGLAYDHSFDVVFSNSSFQWFTDGELALANWHKALRRGGRAGMQAPAKERMYCPNFVSAVEAVRGHPDTGPIFAHFRSPWLLLETAGEYESLFQRAGFEVVFSKLDAVGTQHAPEEVFRLFESGAGVGYLNPNHYDVSIDDGYVQGFLRLVREAFENQADEDGIVDLLFHRVYMLAVKT